MSWHKEAACKGPAGRGIEWVPVYVRGGGMTKAQRANLAAARAVCECCPVRAECLAAALERDDDGIFAGTTRTDRKRMGLRRGRPEPSGCGTDAGYYRHLRSDPPTDPCGPCRDEHNRVARERKREAREGGRRVAECGTDPGYFRHLRFLHDDPCDDCKAAHALAERRWRLGRSG